MADPISGLNGGTPPASAAVDDLIAVVDISDTTQASTGTTKPYPISLLVTLFNSVLNFLSSGDNVSELINDAGYLTTETDPVFSASPAASVINSGGGTQFLADDGTYKTVSIPVDVVGIADASGVYTYYSTLQDANAFASSGDTIELFSDINESGAVTVILKDGVKYNFNGHTYTCSSVGSQDAFNFTTGKTYLFNGKILRTGGDINSEGLNITSSGTVIGNNFQIENTNGAAGTCTGGIVRNIDFINAGSKPAILIESNGRIENCKGYSTSNFGISITNGIGVDCYGYSTVSFGIGGGIGELINCTGESTGNAGISTSTINRGCIGISNAAEGIRIGDHGNELFNCHAYSTGGHAIVGNGKRFKIYNSSLYSTVNYAFNAGSAITGTGDLVFSRCSLESESSYAFLAIISNVGIATVTGCYLKSTGQNAMELGGSNDEFYINNNHFEVTVSGNNCISGVTNAYITANQFSKISTTPIGTTTNLQVKTEDTFGNIQIG